MGIVSIPASDDRMMILIPCYNEEGRIGRVVRSVASIYPEAEIVVINDCATDSSPSEAHDNGATVLNHSCNLGYGAALQTGYMYAVSRGIQILVQLDADGQHDPRSIEQIMEPVLKGKADICIGSRHLADSTTSTPFIRRLGQNIFAMFLKLFGGPPMTDPTSGFQAMNSKAVTLFSDDVFPCDYPDSDVILMAHFAGLRIAEAPAVMHSRSGGLSIHAGFWKPFYYGIKMLFSMIIVFLNRNKWKTLGATISTTGKETE